MRQKERAAAQENKTASGAAGKGRLFTVLFALCLLAALALFIAAPERLLSEPENRLLQTRPEVSADAVFSGSWQKDWEAYLSDQFPGRDELTAFASVIRKTAGQKDIGGAWLADDGFYPEVHTADSFDTAAFSKNLSYVGGFAEKFPGSSSALLLIPDAACVYRDRLPALAEPYDAEALQKLAEELLPGMRVPDLTAAFLDAVQSGPAASLSEDSSNSELYFRTDHHWSAAGVQLAYDLLMNGEGSYQGSPELFSDSFLGSTYSKTLDPAAKPEELYIFPAAEGITVTADGEEISLYDLSAADKKDKYTVFFGGNYGLVTIQTPAGTGKSLLVIKDSFANSLAPLLTADYDTITMVDLRYFGGSAASLAAMTQPDQILFVYSMSNLEQGSELVKLLLP
ncbi:MAG: hypothetical protein J5865_06205 [Lachnospiraceae bacterium]|nr:hypothetical protein [Lachnospiraceae bacterium]